MSSMVDENRVNELVESLKQFPDVDKYLIWVCAVDYVMRDEMKLNIDDQDIKLKVDEIYNSRNENKYVYENITLKDENINIFFFPNLF
jgi:hypothetical protein